MIAELLGIPEHDRYRLRPWSAAIVKMYEMSPSEEEITKSDLAAREFMDYTGMLAEERRARPQDDLISALVHAEEQGASLSEDELRATCIFLLNAGIVIVVALLIALFIKGKKMALQQQLQ